MTVFEHDGWSIRDNGPGFWAADPDDRVSVYLDGDCLHYEASGLASNECEIPMVIIDRLRELTRGGES